MTIIGNFAKYFILARKEVVHVPYTKVTEATGPFITTVNDIIGLMIYFAVGGVIAGYLI